MNNDCILCSFQEACSGKPVFLYACTPILREIVASHLEEMKASYRLQGELFRVDSDQSLAIQGLRTRLSDAERADVRVSREQGAALLVSSTLDVYGRHLDTEWFDTALHNDSFTSFFQPIVDTGSDSGSLTIFGYECLIRLFADRPYNGGEIIEAAFARGSIHLFDSYARRLSVRKAGEQFIPGTKVFINFMPSSIYDPAFCMASTLEEMSRTTLRPQDIVFEVVESEAVTDVKHLKKICDFYRKEGFAFALDDVGTGSSSLQMICDLKPDYIKLDKSFISRVSEPMYRSVVEKLTEFATNFGLEVIAEGIETVETLQALRDMGIHLMQGYYFAKPSARMTTQLSGLSTDLKNLGDNLGQGVAPSGVATGIVSLS